MQSAGTEPSIQNLESEAKVLNWAAADVLLNVAEACGISAVKFEKTCSTFECLQHLDSPDCFSG